MLRHLYSTLIQEAGTSGALTSLLPTSSRFAASSVSSRLFSSATAGSSAEPDAYEVDDEASTSFPEPPIRKPG